MTIVHTGYDVLQNVVRLDRTGGEVKLGLATQLRRIRKKVYPPPTRTVEVTGRTHGRGAWGVMWMEISI